MRLRFIERHPDDARDLLHGEAHLLELAHVPAIRERRVLPTPSRRENRLKQPIELIESIAVGEFFVKVAVRWCLAFSSARPFRLRLTRNVLLCPAAIVADVAPSTTTLWVTFGLGLCAAETATSL